MSACDIIEDWDDNAFSGDGGRLDQLRDLIAETMETYGFDPAAVDEQPGLMDDEGVPARFDPDENTIYFDPDYLAGDSITPDEAINLAVHESIHAMDYQEDGAIDIREGDVMSAAFGMSGEAIGDCRSAVPESGGSGGDTGGW